MRFRSKKSEKYHNNVVLYHFKQLFSVKQLCKDTGSVYSNSVKKDFTVLPCRNNVKFQ